MSFSEKTQELLKQREKDYGHYVDTFDLIARMWTGYLGYHILPSQVSDMMAILKLCREVRKHKQDNLDDLNGYLEISKNLKKTIEH
jgi:hypothetical protein